MDASSRPDEYEHSLPDVMYVTSNIPGAGCRAEDFDLAFSVGCSCTRECQADCSCTRGHRNYVDGRLSWGNENSMIVECNPNCACDNNCGNRLVQQGPLDCLLVKEAPSVGLALVASKRVEKGRFVCEYAGEVVGIDEARRRLEENKVRGRMNYVLVVSEHVGEQRIITTCIDPAKFGNIGRYANHSCEPNARLVPVRVDVVVPRLCLFALRDIQAGEEITFHYAGDAAAAAADASVHCLSETPCLCGSASCLGYLPHSTV